MPTIINNKIFKLTFLFLILAEILSFLGWLIPSFNAVCFFVILVLTLVLSLKDLRYGLLIIFAELFIGSKGYLFSLEFGETLLSIRIGLFLVIMAVWFLNILKSYINTHSPRRSRRGNLHDEQDLSLGENASDNRKSWFSEFKTLKRFVPLGIVILWALVWGIIRGNDFGNVFLDFNGWIYFLLILPVFAVSKRQKTETTDNQEVDKKDFMQDVLSVLSAGVLWLGIKSLFLLYIFSHNSMWALPEIYIWLRDTAVGEVARAPGGFWRVFIQSQIYSLIFFFIALTETLSGKIKNKKTLIANYVLLIIAIATLVLSFSRSYWLGLVVGILACLFLLLVISRKSIISLFKPSVKILMIVVVGLVLVFAVINLPPRGEQADLSSLKKRVSEMEAASSSRMKQLKPLFNEIIKHPVIGSGFGTTVTYTSLDPRILNSTAGGSGEITTYAFEWGYLDMLLKFGLAGLTIYFLLIWRILKGLLKSSYESGVINQELRLGVCLALVALLVVNMFSPYLNHPLGIGFVILASLIVYE